MQYDLIPGRAVVRVFAHQVQASRGPVFCHSWVTTGLAGFGQREIVFTMVRHPQAGIEHAPREPVQLLQTIAGLAQQGRLVTEGGFTEVGPTGMFGRPSLRGLVYQAAWPMDSVVIPNGALQAIVLAGYEMETAKRYGSLRVLARLGNAHKFFPTAVWCEPDRQPLFGPESGSILEGVAGAIFAGVSVVLEGERITVRLPRETLATLKQSGLPPPEAGVAFFTTLDANADACLVWTPGQKSPEAISPPGSRGARMSGCYVMFVPQQQYDGGAPFEDGFAVMLTDASWVRVRQALMTGATIEIPGNKSLALEWFDPTKPTVAAGVPAVSEMRMHLRESQADIEARMGMNALVEYANAVEQTVQRHFAAHGRSGPGSNLELEIVLGAGRPPHIQISVSDPTLHAALAAIRPPPIRSGEIAFRGSFALFGGAS